MRPNRTQFTRHALVVLLALSLVAVGVGVTRASNSFPDVVNGDFFHDAVDFLVSLGITAGIGGGLYGPDQAVTRGQMAVFLERALSNCPPDAVRVGPTCIDRYGASVWRTTDAALVRKIRLGTATRTELQAGATQLGLASGDLAGAGCSAIGNGCTDIYAVSVAGVRPAVWITWYQAVTLARNAGKRLPTIQEWWAAAQGTPEAAPCIAEGGLTGAPGCVSEVGAFDMGGSFFFEWLAEWVTPISDGLGQYGPASWASFRAEGSVVWQVSSSDPLDRFANLSFRAAR